MILKYIISYQQVSCPVSRTNDCIYNLVSIDIEILVSGVLLWSLVHFVPSIAQPVKKRRYKSIRGKWL